MSSNTGGSEELPVSDSSLDMMLSAAGAAVESTSVENNDNSSDISDDTRLDGLASDFTSSSEADVTVEPGAVGAGPSMQHQGSL